MFYDRYIKLCNQVKKAPSAVAEEIGLSRASVYGWKNGKSPTDATLRKIADYFSVPMAYLSGEVDSPENRSRTHWMELYNDKA